MKRFLLFLLSMFVCVAYAGAQGKAPAKASAKWPTFSTEDGSVEIYYHIKFNRDGYVMSQTTASGETDLVRLYSANESEDQQWKLVGTKDNFQIVNKDGSYCYVSNNSKRDWLGGLTWKTNSNPLRFSTTTKQEGGFSLAKSTNTTNGLGFEIKANNRSGEAYLNSFGEARNGNFIGIYTTGDPNNVVTFTRTDEYSIADYASTGISGYVPENNLTLWYTEPATTAKLGAGGQGYSNWMEYSLPIGDGQFGASLFGGMYKDEIQFNEKTLWSGTSDQSPDGGTGYGKYENFGSVYATNLNSDFGTTSDTGAKNYLRQLDLTTATGMTQFTSQNGTTYTRQYFASNPAHVVAARYTASASGKISMNFTLEPGAALDAEATYENGEATFSGKLDLVSYNARMKVIPTGGTMTTSEYGIEVIGANEVLVILAGGTDYDISSSTYVSNTSALPQTIQQRVQAAAAQGWSQLLADHVADHQLYFNRVSFQLEGVKNTVPTNELIDNYNSGKGTDANMLEQLYFAYGRYLEIASSRGVSLPSNLQGIWNNMANPAWNCDIHSNINVQMNYWPAEPTNLSEMHLPFLHYIKSLATEHSEWQQWAKLSGQDRGWTLYTENNIFGGVSSFKTNYVIANAWYVSHLWQHYRYTLDKAYLKEVFPAMLSAAQFWMDRLVLDSDGTYVAPNEWSPEHGPDAENGTAHAQQLVNELFSNTLQAIEVLGTEANISATDLSTLQDRYNKLDKGLRTETYNLSSWDFWHSKYLENGTPILREWKTSDYTKGEREHRHMSHLMCLYPFSQVAPGTDLFRAAVNSLKLRGDDATGWSMGWKMNLWAHALDGEHAHKILTKALAHCASDDGAGVFYNLYDAHAPFQIDGNFGACSGITEMLMQSNSDTIRVLPALPSAWPTGEISGLKTVKDFTVSLIWKDGKASRITITNNQGQTIPLLYKNLKEATCYINDVQTDIEMLSDSLTMIGRTAGTVYVFDFDGSYVVPSVTLDEQGTANSSILQNLEAGVYTFNIKRTLKGDSWSSIVLPFDVDEATLKSVFGENVVLADFTGHTATTLLFTKVNEMEAGKAYVIKVSTDIVDAQTTPQVWSFPHISSWVSNCKDNAQAGFDETGVNSFVVNYVGTFNATTATAGPNEHAKYVLSDNKIYRLSKDTAMKGFRALFEDKSENSSKPSLSDWTIDDITTGIHNAVNEELQSTKVYNLNGQQVGNNDGSADALPKGIYIVNGRKHVVK